ncbi:hypothetical protein ACFPIJ_35305 [Dactylosporangium cerinum]|uniref:DUF3592 domain-containing protein n=1 Tax=Dactylosporangium cerinum TaxID=1434730 RepID=A0ABV9W343_9ACTN
MRAYQAPWSNRALLVMVAVTTLVGAGLLLLAWRSDVEGRRMRDAPQCAPAQVFTSAKCRAVLDGTVTWITTSQAQVDVDGHHLTMPTAPFKNLPAAGERPARATLYRGKVVRVEADGRLFNATDTPQDSRDFVLALGVFCLAAGPINALALLARRGSGQKAGRRGGRGQQAGLRAPHLTA